MLTTTKFIPQFQTLLLSSRPIYLSSSPLISLLSCLTDIQTQQVQNETHDLSSRACSSSHAPYLSKWQLPSSQVFKPKAWKPPLTTSLPPYQIHSSQALTTLPLQVTYSSVPHLFNNFLLCSTIWKMGDTMVNKIDMVLTSKSSQLQITTTHFIEWMNNMHTWR